MISLRTKKCKCGKSEAYFGFKGDNPTCCVRCKESSMLNLRKTFCKCGKSQAYFGFKTDVKGTCCAICRSEGMIDIVSPKCPGLINFELKGSIECPYSQRRNKKYDNYCTKCFEQNFPDDPRSSSIRERSHELVVKKFLSTEFKEFIHNTALWTGQADCTCRRRIDFRWLIGNTLLCVEVDENQHKYRDKEDELMRYDDLMMLHGGKFIFIRYNPDVYIGPDATKKNPEVSTRLKALKETILKQIKRIQDEENDDLVEVDLLFYDYY
jgi:hypothetical protein